MEIWNAGSVPDQSGRRIVVTGAGSGLGLVVTRALVRRGAEIVMAARDVGKAERHRDELLAEHPAGSLDVRALDLLDPASIRSFAAAVAAERVDALLNVAGIANVPLQRSAQGMESQFATNHLGHFALSALLLDALTLGQEPRVVTVSSWMYRSGRLDPDDLTDARRYSAVRAYTRSKLANVLFALELDRRLRDSGSPVRSLLAHPGMATTPMHQNPSSWADAVVTRAMSAAIARTAEEGVLPILYAATAPRLDGGTFAGPRSHLGPMRVAHLGVHPPGDDQELAQRLWTVSEELTGIRPELLRPTAR